MTAELTYHPADEDDAAWLPREDAMQAFQVVEDEEAPSPEEDGALTQETRQALSAEHSQSTTRVDLLRFLESLTPAEARQWVDEGHIRPAKG